MVRRAEGLGSRKAGTTILDTLPGAVIRINGKAGCAHGALSPFREKQNRRPTHSNVYLFITRGDIFLFIFLASTNSAGIS